MGTEIERKYLVQGDAWRALGEAVSYRQGYLSEDRVLTVRVRIAGGQGELTLKKSISRLTNAEFNFPIPLEEAEELLETFCVSAVIEKNRSRIEIDELVWEVDEFHGANEGLLLAEVELSSEDQTFDLPSWVGPEVTDDSRYKNAALARHPYSEW